MTPAPWWPCSHRPAETLHSMWSLVLALAALLGFLVGRRRQRANLPASAVILSPRKSTVTASDGAVRSVQSAELTMPRDQLEQLWAVPNLENLARTYWRFLTRVTLGVVRVVYGENERSVVFLARPFTVPALHRSGVRGRAQPRKGHLENQVAGLLVARAGRGCGYLALDVRRLDEPNGSDQGKVRIEVEVANFYPSIAVRLQHAGLRGDSVRHPRAGDPRLPALAGPTEAGPLKGGPTPGLNGAQAVASAAARARRSVTHSDGPSQADQPERRGPLSRSGRR